jgi:putative colanic acid biosysnthesis UDP-glucose lipid carrier transferase
MIAVQDLQHFGFRRWEPGAATLAEMLIEPAVAIGALLAAAACFRVPFAGSYVILALLVFAMTFPGEPPSSRVPFLRVVVPRWALTVTMLLLIGWAAGALPMLDRRVLLAWAVATPGLLYGAHRLCPVLLTRFCAVKRVQRKAVVAGANAIGRKLVERLDANRVLGVRFVGYFDDRCGDRLEDVEPRRLLGQLGGLASYVKQHHIEVIYVALPMCSQPRVRKLLEELRDTTASIYFVPDILLFDLIQARVDTIDGIPVLAVCESPYRGLNGLIKRVSDIVLASTILIATAPLWLFVAIGIKWTSRGPVLFKQRRYGLDGKEMVIYKFRTMFCLEDGDAIKQAAEHDPRTTRFGAFLRRYSLDELPQLINVLQGRMSVVGPRPHAVAHNELYRKVIRGYMMRHKVKPGITGLAQVNGLRGETATVEKMQARIECDLEYLRRWSPLFDLSIALKTIPVILSRKNAY